MRSLARAARGREEEEKMPEHKIGTREEWQAARDELAKLEAETGQRNEEIKKKRRELPWVPRENGTVYHTYTVAAPDPFVVPYYSFLLERVPKAPPDEPRAWRKDEYPD